MNVDREKYHRKSREQKKKKKAPLFLSEESSCGSWTGIKTFLQLNFICIVQLGKSQIKRQADIIGGWGGGKEEGEGGGKCKM